MRGFPGNQFADHRNRNAKCLLELGPCTLFTFPKNNITKEKPSMSQQSKVW